jgi:hypothetical protein
MTSPDLIPVPMRELAPARLTALKHHLIAEVTHVARPGEKLVGRWSSSRRRAFALSIALALLGVGTAVAATSGWLSGSPAPQSVVADFGSYTPQLGFNPDPGGAVQVASDGDAILYATTNSQGSYCVVASLPWKRPSQNPDGGSCVNERTARQDVVAGVVGGSKTDADGNLTLAVAGRISTPHATSIEITLPDASTRNLLLGPSGFFVLMFPTQLCHNWSATITALDVQGRRLTASTIVLERAIQPSGTQDPRFAVCSLPGLTSEAAPSVQVGP